jgi:hypothetical protein
VSVVIADGIYEILCAADPTKAIDCQGASDNIGANIWLYNRNGSAAQYVSITNDDDGVQMVITLSGRAIDVAGGSFKNGSNVQQWEDNNSRAQRWDIDADGKTVTLNGTAYSSYVIKSHGTNYALDISGGGTKSGTNIQIYIANGTDAQRWLFIPIPYFNATGTYKIVSALDPEMCLDVAGGSTANAANVQLYTDNSTGAQGWLSAVNDDQTVCLINCKSMKALDDTGGTGQANAQIYNPNRSAAQRFFVKRYGTMKYGGQTVPTYLIITQAGSGSKYALDAAGGKSAKGTNIQFYTLNYSDAQRWGLIPESVYKDWGMALNTPAFVDFGTSIGNDRTTAQFKFSCAWHKFQIRVRFRVRRVNANSFSDWSIWKSAYDGLGGNGGWCDAWTANMTWDSGTDDTKTFEVPIPEEYRVDGSSIIAMECEAEMRAFNTATVKDSTGASYTLYYHGASANKIKTYYFKPTAGIGSVQLSGGGVSVGYASDLESGGCTVEVWYDGIKASATGKYGGKGSVLIPNKEITSYPSAAVCQVRVISPTHVKSDIVSSKITSISDADNRASIDITQSESEYGTHLITIPGVLPAKNANDEIVLRLTQNGKVAPAYVKETTSTATIYEAVSPLASEDKLLAITALIWITKSDGSWDVKEIALSPISDHAYCWTFEGGGAVLDYGLNAGPTQEDNEEREVETYKIIGRDYESYRFKKTKTRDLSVTGVVVKGRKGNGHGSYDQFVALLNAGHATYRNRRGEIISVAVTAVSKPLEHRDYTEIKITQHQESR